MNIYTNTPNTTYKMHPHLFPFNIHSIATRVSFTRFAFNFYKKKKERKKKEKTNRFSFKRSDSLSDLNNIWAVE